MEAAEPVDSVRRPTEACSASIERALAALESARARFAGTNEWSSPVAWRRHTAQDGLAGLDLPSRVGGAACTARGMVDVFARCGELSLELRDVPGGGHARFLSGARTTRFDDVLRDVAAGRAFAALAITEPDAGSDLHGLTTTATPDGDTYVLRGRKHHVARLAEASHAIVLAHVPRPDAVRTLTAFLVHLDQAGLHRERVEAVGLEGVSFGGLVLDDVRVPRASRVGGEGEAFSLFVKHFSYWRTAMAAVAVGSARAAIDQTIPWLRTRHAFGGPIGRFTHLQQQLAEHVARLHMAWLLVCHAADRLDARRPVFADAAMAKAEAVESAIAAVDWTMRVHGARGHTTAMDLERRFRGLLCLRIADGTTDVLRGQVARAVVGNDIYEWSLGRRESAVSEGGQIRRRFW